MRCQRCGNKIKELFIRKSEGNICRKCLVYKDKITNKSYFHGKGNYKLGYDLTALQIKASKFLLDKIKNGKNCILNAVTGAGKTEIIYPLIEYCVNNNLKIGIVIPRKDVVIELFNRISNDFKEASITMVCGGNNKILYADIIVLTSHQLYRYEHYFEVIVIDEVDAFPFYNNKILNNFLKRSLAGNVVYMSATIPKELLSLGYECFYLKRRYHENDLDIPKLKYFWGLTTLKKFINKHKMSIVLIYFPTIKEQLKISRKLKIDHYVINSKVTNREQLIEELHQLKSGVILTTLVLERGITFNDTHVIVYKADHSLFRYENLVQISGRVGRKKDFPHGEILFLISKVNKNIKKAIKFIKRCNE